MPSDVLGYDAETIGRIVRFADTHDLPPIGLLAIGLQESGLNVWEHTGDRGQSEGCFQIRMWDDEGTPVHGGPPGRWQGYDGLDASMAEMGAQWHQTFVDRGGWIAWVQNVIRFIYDWAPAAQVSVLWTRQMAEERISLASAIYVLWHQAQQSPPAPSYRTELVAALTQMRQDAGDDRARAGLRHEWAIGELRKLEEPA